jgi:hypothetical protein
MNALESDTRPPEPEPEVGAAAAAEPSPATAKPSKMPGMLTKKKKAGASKLQNAEVGGQFGSFEVEEGGNPLSAAYFTFKSHFIGSRFHQNPVGL